MSSNEKNASTVDFKRARIVSTFKDLNRAIDDRNDIISRLTRRLQTTLNSADLIRIFAEEVAQIVSFDQFCHEAEDGTKVTVGNKSGAHSCQYNLNLDEHHLGSLKLSRRKRFLEEELAIIERLAGTLVFPLRNAALYRNALQSALQDELTGCGNKRALDAGLHREAELARRHDSPLSILMLDADHFKQINDNYGHGAGDHVLKELAKLIKRCARQSDLCFRYGGEEFLLILDKTDADQAFKVAERIRRSIAEYRFEHSGKIIPVTLSLGAATYDMQETLENLKQRADYALYAAKKGGRNRSIAHELLEKRAESGNLQIAQGAV